MFVWKEIPVTVQSRSPPYLTKSELSRLMSWKLKRGKWRPRLQSLIESNSEDAVKEASTAALNRLEREDSVTLCLDDLCTLKGVGPATASAVFAAISENYPFMSDELLEAVPHFKGVREYTKVTYLKLVGDVRSKARDLGNEWTPRMVEQAVYAEAKLVVLKKHPKSGPPSSPSAQSTRNENATNSGESSKNKRSRGRSRDADSEAPVRRSKRAR